MYGVQQEMRAAGVPLQERVSSGINANIAQATVLLGAHGAALDATAAVGIVGLTNRAGDSGKGVINPSAVRFTQDSAANGFGSGGTVRDLADALRSGAVKPEQIPAIRLFERDGKVFTLDNRRLEAFRRAGVDVPYRMATPQEVTREAWKFTTRNDGVSTRIRGE